MANVFSILLNFKADLGGLAKFNSAIEDRIRKVQAYNLKLQNGGAAINNVLQAGAAFFAAGKLREYSREATEAAKAQGQLEQALARTHQNSAGYRAELAAQASALQEVTGVDDDYIKTVQRELIFNKARREDLQELTSLTLDFAAAKGIDAAMAAKLVGKSLTGDEEDLKRYGVELGKSADRVTALKEGLKTFRGQAAQAFAALPEDMRRFQIASNDASKAAGALVNEIASPFIRGLATGLQNANERMRDLRENGSALTTIFKQLSAAVGDFIGRHLDKILLLVGGILALKAANYALTQTMIMMGSAFVALTTKEFIPLIKAIQVASAEVGILRAIAGGGWVAAFGASLALAGGALAAFAIGSAAIKALENSALSRLEGEDKVRQTLADQTKELAKQLASVHDLKEAQAARAAIEKQIEAAAAERDALERKKAEAEAAADLQRDLLGAGGGDVSLAAPALAFSSKDQAHLDALQKQIGDLAQLDRIAVDAGAIARIIERNPVKPAVEVNKADIELAFALADARRKELAALTESGNQIFLQAEEQKKKLELFQLETQAQKAEAAGNSKLAEQLRAQIKLKEYENELGVTGMTAAKKRVDAENAVTAVARARQTAEQELSRQIAAGEAALQIIDQSRLLTQEQKDRARVQILEEINRKIGERIALLEREQALSPDPQRQAQIDQLRGQQGQNAAGIAGATSLTPQQGMLAGVVDYLNKIPTLAERARQTIKSISDALEGGISSSIEGLIKRTMTWRDALLNIAGSVVNSVIAAFANMVAQWIVRAIMMAAFGPALAAAQLAAVTPVAAAASAIWAAPATLATIATLGGAAIAAPLEIGASMLATRAMTAVPGMAAGGLVKGEGTGTSDSVPIRASDGEFVVRAAAVDRFGPEFFQALNSGAMDLDAAVSSVPRGLASGVGPAAGPAGGAAAGGGFDQAALVHALSRMKITYVSVDDEREAKRIARRSQAANDIVHIVRANRSEIFRQGP